MRKTGDGRACLQALSRQMDEGLAGRGKIPMLPSDLSTKIAVPEGAVCAVLDAGGTNLRTARAVWDGNACLIGATRAAWAEKM